MASLALQVILGPPGFLASICVGLVGSFLPESRFFDSKKCVACIYAGSFAAMSAQSLIANFWDALIISLFLGVSFKLISPYFKGLGGKLGSIAFVAVLFFALLKEVL